MKVCFVLLLAITQLLAEPGQFKAQDDFKAVPKGMKFLVLFISVPSLFIVSFIFYDNVRTVLSNR
jgi:hypothetical protein